LRCSAGASPFGRIVSHQRGTYTNLLQPLGAHMPKSAFNPTDKHVGSRLRMRRLMLDMSQTQLGDALGVTFQQVQKYEKGRNRISASRLQHLSQILQVPVPFFFEGAPAWAGIAPAAREEADAPSPAYVSDFLSTSAGLELVKAFMCIESRKLRRSIVELVEQIAETH
jgi:transcriptional regulator with XRE-family HTH domain